MQAVGKGKISFYLAVIRQLFLNIPILLIMNRIFGVSGIVWTQMIADCLNVIVSYIVYFRVSKNLEQKTA
jgi:Na+-driven multidrug efflux pump